MARILGISLGRRDTLFYIILLYAANFMKATLKLHKKLFCLLMTILCMYNQADMRILTFIISLSSSPNCRGGCIVYSLHPFAN